MTVEAHVKARYADGANEREEALCCPVDYDPQYLKIIPQDVLDRDYGCGDPSRYVREGDTVLVLATGRFCVGWGEMADSLGATVETIDFGDSDAVDLAQVEAALKADTEGRIKAVLTYLGGFSEDDFKDCKDRIIHLPFLPPGKAVKGRHYVNDMALPNFYFHVTTAYAILRHNEVDVGKRDFIGSMVLEDVETSA